MRVYLIGCVFALSVTAAFFVLTDQDCQHSGTLRLSDRELDHYIQNCEQSDLPRDRRRLPELRREKWCRSWIPFWR